MWLEEAMLASVADIWCVPESTLRALVDSRCTRPQAQLPRHDLHDGPMAGDSRLPADATTITRSIAVCRPAAAVWPWLAQLMRGGGVYGCALFETRTCHSAEYLLSDLPTPRVGDRLGDVLTLVHVDPGRELIWSAQRGVHLLGFLIRGLTLDYLLEPLGESTCVLRVRLRAVGDDLTEPVEHYLFAVLDYLLCAPQAERIRQYAERPSTIGQSADPSAHQAAAFTRSDEANRARNAAPRPKGEWRDP